MHVQRGQSCAHAGITQRRIDGEHTVSHLELFPEEAVYLIERGALDARWTQTPGAVPTEAAWETGLPISVAQAYAQLLGGEATLARYQIYAYLRRLGYIVQRSGVVDQLRKGAPPPQARRDSTARRLARLVLRWLRALLQRLLYVLRLVLRRRTRGLLGISPFDSFGTSCASDPDTVFDKLRIVHSGLSVNDPSVDDDELRPFFYAWRPATHFKRTQPPPPEFRICVLDTEAHAMLRGPEMARLFAHVPLPTDADDADALALDAIRARNRQAYGKQKPPRAPRRAAPSAQAAAPRITALARCVAVLGAVLAWLRRVAQRVGVVRCAPSRHPPSNVYIPLKTGRRTVVVAIVEQGTMSLLRFGEAEFARWRLAGHRD